MSEQPEAGIPILTDVVERENGPAWPTANEALVAELQTRIAAQCFSLTEDAVRRAFAEMEATLFEQISARLRRALPEVIDTILRERLETWEPAATPPGAEDPAQGSEDNE